MPILKIRNRFFGHSISFNFIRPTQEKITKVLCFKEPNSLKTVRAFIGLTSYYKLFGKDFSTIAAPLYKCAGGKKFHWNEECREAYEILKNSLADKCLIMPDFEKEFILDTDASAKGIGGVLSQKIEGYELPIANYSKSLTETEQKYAT